MNEQVTDYTSANRSSLERTVEGAVRRLLGYGLAAKVRFTTSLRVGSGAATMATIDGTDGSVMADGAVAGFLTRDRANNTRYGEFYRNTTIRIFASETGDLWLIDPTTGFFTLATAGGWVKVAGGIGFTNSWTDFDAAETTYNQAGYKKYPDGTVALRGAIKSGTIATAAFTLPVGSRPLKTQVFGGIDGASSGQRVDVSSSGIVVPTTGNNGFFSLSGVRFDTQ